MTHRESQPLLEIQGLTLHRGPCPVLHDITLSLRPGECLGLIGPNGAGKSTLMRAALGLIAPSAGHSSLARLAPRARAAQLAWLPQARDVAWPVSVAHLVGLGARARGRPGDHPLVGQALARLGLQAQAGRAVTSLSGGEQARVLIARALAQDTPLILADEPTAGLDPAQQIRCLALLRALADEGRGVMISLHDLGLAARHCTRLVVLDQGRIIADGPPAQVLTPALLAQVFDIRAHLQDGPEGLILQPLATMRP